jgi:hypothetical protein
MAFLIDAAKDAAITYIVSGAGAVTQLFICEQEPVSYSEASTAGTYSLGSKASPSLGAAADGATQGRRTVVSAITDGTVTHTGTATHWALCTASVLIATGLLSASQAVTSGNTFTLASFSITVNDAT